MTLVSSTTSSATTSTATVTVTTPSRLHFGMIRVGHRRGRQFGGVGAMVDAPGIELHIAPAGQLAIDGPLADRVQKFGYLTEVRSTTWGQLKTMYGDTSSSVTPPNY